MRRRFPERRKIKGAHIAIKTGMLAAENVYAALDEDDKSEASMSSFDDAVKQSWIHEELYRARNFGPALHKLGTFFGAAFAFIEQNIFRGKLPITLRN